jgi:LysR family glycine cleavage system transcriptional activator
VAQPFVDDWTCGIRLGDGNWPGVVAEPLFAADLQPVCTPRLADRLKRPGDLDPNSLIRVAHAPEDWPLWLKTIGVAKMPAKGPQFDYYGQALQAALDGVGVAMGIRPYIDDDIAAGRLVAPFASVPKGSKWYLIYQETRAAESGFLAFRQWLARSASAAPPGCRVRSS